MPLYKNRHNMNHVPAVLCIPEYIQQISDFSFKQSASITGTPQVIGKRGANPPLPSQL
jgi:hypothetical protein